MSKYAYIDKEKTKIIDIDNITEKNINSKFYCLGKNCNAILKIKAVDSVKVDPYFYSINDYPHKKNCIYKNINQFFHCNNNEINLKNFYFNLIQSSKNNSNKVTTISSKINQNEYTIPQNLKSLFFHLIQLDIYKKINDFFIKDILIYENTYHIYTKYIRDLKIIHAELNFIDFNNKILTFKYPEIENSLNFKINISNLNINIEYFSNKLHSNFIIMAQFDKSNYSELISKKQLVYLK